MRNIPDSKRLSVLSTPNIKISGVEDLLLSLIDILLCPISSSFRTPTFSKPHLSLSCYSLRISTLSNSCSLGTPLPSELLLSSNFSLRTCTAANELTPDIFPERLPDRDSSGLLSPDSTPDLSFQLHLRFSAAKNPLNSKARISTSLTRNPLLESISRNEES